MKRGVALLPFVFLLGIPVASADSPSSSFLEFAKIEQEMAAFANDYRNPLIRLPMTFIEIFPAGFLVSLISAGILRTKK